MNVIRQSNQRKSHTKKNRELVFLIKKKILFDLCSDLENDLDLSDSDDGGGGGSFGGNSAPSSTGLVGNISGNVSGNVTSNVAIITNALDRKKPLTFPDP